MTGIDFIPGKIVFNDMETLSDVPLIEQMDLLEEDLLQVEFPRTLLLDVGWYGEYPTGQFIVYILLNQNWSNPVWRRETSSTADLREILKDAVQYIGNRLRILLLNEI